ncbi:MAG: zinc ribbon domain-containing protein [Bacillus sp. (in: firmicutes)]
MHKGEDRLSHVEPYLQLNEYFNFQERLGSHLEEYREQIDQLNTQNIFIPRCGYCQKPMNYWKDNLNQYAFYSCSNKHQKVTVPFQEFVQIIQLTLEEIVTNLDSKKLLNHSITRLRQIKKEFEIKYTSISHQLMELTEQLLLNTATANDWKRSDEYKKLSQLKEEQHLLVKELEEKEQLLEENKEVVDAVNKYLHDRCKLDPSLLYSMFIKDVFIYEDFIDFEVCKFDYLENMQSDFIYKGEHLA